MNLAAVTLVFQPWRTPGDDRVRRINSYMKTITIPPNTSRDERDAIIRRATTQFTRALRRMERLREADAQRQPMPDEQEHRPC